MVDMTELGYQNASDAIPFLGGLLENFYQYWCDDYSCAADYVDFFTDGFSAEDFAAMRQEFVSLSVDTADDGDVETFLRRMNANYRLRAGSGRALLDEVGQRIEQLAGGAVPKAAG